MGVTANQAREPEHPFPVTDVDKRVPSKTDEEFKYHDWDELRRIIDTNDLSALKRKPSDLGRYIEWTAETKATYGSITDYLMQYRLPRSWGTIPFTPASQIPFADPSDYSVLLNDWPYGLAPGITHIVVWTRTAISTDPESGDVTDESRKLISDFVKTHFVDKLGPGGNERVMWFKNWAALQSVPALEHIHVLVKDVDPAVIAGWTEPRLP